MRNQFEADLKSLQEMIIELAEKTKKAVIKSMEAFRTENIELALEVIDEDDRINKLEKEVNELILVIITRQQPVAVDLRRNLTAIKIAHDLERVADYAVNIAKSTIRIRSRQENLPLENIEKMHELGLDMLTKASEAYRTEDLQAAKEIGEIDDIVDELYGTTVRTLMSSIADSPEHVSNIMQMAFICRYLERIADYATNIAENIYYLVKGKHYLLNQ
ncbi:MULTISPECIES: phosphate signaling complex protein PhoU [Bacillaceae]|jgi:phosphate transport system protein|uniref:Phosphate-specific transport system accessory protein PhoU n=1 Tax=Gottfriedia luciferensis TaxID=178774 RepID=A0ABX2ZNQ7_9BACI|nr:MULTISPECIES: phosphate signaling complex protein PhoU [Bacillaceae]ODG91350.1 phosphate transport system regulatory protein PhoU [Gottfriedia luciferensis]PGZ92014.1 phosphate transport system regulatory protein PhoU [Bacillus sp. AFS029533]SFD57494.1 phosphate transport system protein [Bacillus sp. UNCCL81]